MENLPQTEKKSRNTSEPFRGCVGGWGTLFPEHTLSRALPVSLRGLASDAMSSRLSDFAAVKCELSGAAGNTGTRSTTPNAPQTSLS